MFDKIVEVIEEHNGFDCEVIYYGSAMDYLKENDTSLKESLELAHDLGYTADNINSELLASLLKSQNVREDFQDLESEINTFFEELYEELQNEE